MINLFIIITFSFLLRLFLIRHSSITFFSDDAIYASLARMFFENRWYEIFHPTWPPLFPFLSAITYLLLQNWENSLRIVSALSGVLFFIPIFYLAKKTLSKTHATTLILILALIHPLIYASIFPLSDSLSATLILSGLILFFFGLEKFNQKYLILASFFFGLAYLTRSEGSLFFLLSLAYLSFTYLPNLLKDWKKIFPIIGFILVFYITTSPYLIATKSQLGEWNFSAKFSAQIQQEHAFALRKNGTTWSQEIVSVKSPNYQSQYFHGGYRFVLDNQRYLTWWFTQKFQKWEKVFFSFFPFWYFSVIVVGILNSLLKKPFRPHFYLIFILITTIPITIFSTAISDIRYLLWTIPLFIYYFYLGIHSLFALTKLPIPIFKGSALTAFVLSLQLSIISLNALSNPLSYADDFTKLHYNPLFIETANWIKLQKENSKIMMRHEMIEFYAKGETVYIPQVAYEKVIEYAREYKVDYLVAWSGELEQDSNLSFLLSPDSKTPGLTLVYSKFTPKERIIIYKLLQNSESN